MRDLNQEFSGYTGTDHYYRHMFGAYTDGVCAMAEKFEAHWLLDIVFSYGIKESFQIWEIVSKDNKAVVTMKLDSEMTDVITQEIEFTDFPEGKMKFYLIDGILMLPSEY
ncbi:MAG: DUF6876 family protein [Acholeplasmataceae bacterium]